MASTSEEKMYSIYIDDEFVCEVLARHRVLATVKAWGIESFQEVIRKKGDQMYDIQAYPSSGVNVEVEPDG